MAASSMIDGRTIEHDGKDWRYEDNGAVCFPEMFDRIPNPVKSLFQSRKFLLLLLDTVVSVGLFFVGKYTPLAYEDVAFMIGALQPVFVAVILGIAHEDAAEKGAQ